MIKLSKWAKEHGIGYKTAWSWVHKGTFPGDIVKLSTGTILVKSDELNKIEDKTVIYCRVSNHSRKKELEYQVKRCEDFCLANGWVINKVFKEIASGLNDNRKEFWKMIESNPSRIVVENKDRLTRFGFNYLKVLLLHKHNTEIIVMHEDKEDEKDLIKDLCSVIYSFCAKLYGMRRAANKAKKIRETLNEDVSIESKIE
jgi:putative resolvase